MFKGFKSILTVSLIMAFVFLNCAFMSPCQAETLAGPLKIEGLKFDNSDNLVIIESEGEILLPSLTSITPQNGTSAVDNSYNEITKGFLKEPSRHYVDITNAILAGAAKNYELKNSIFKSVRVSQFSINPNIVRLVFSYADTDSANNSAFSVLANNKGIVIKYKNSLNKTEKNSVVYSDTPDSERIVFFENTSAVLDSGSASYSVSNGGDTKDELNKMFEKNNEKINAGAEYKLNSKFYISSIGQSQNGIMIKGMGLLSLKPAFLLEAPDRMVIDFDDTVVAKNLRNKSFSIGPAVLDSQGNISKREVLRIGQNSSNVARVVIQGPEAKNYRAVVSPDLQNVFIAKRSDVINSKITETPGTIKAVNVLKDETKGGYKADTVEFDLTAPAAFSVFEENKNLYLDFNNVSSINEEMLNNLKKSFENVQTVKIALDKLRFVFPLDDDITNVQARVSPDSKVLSVVLKKKYEEEEQKESIISKLITKEPSISNLYKVVIDAGHGGSDVGATRDGVYEKNITLSIAKMVEKNLAAKGVQTTMTLERDKTVSLQERCDISNKAEPDVFVSIHVNSSVNSAIYGVETHWWKDDSKTYASTVHKHLAKNFGKWSTKDRGLFRSQFYVINHTEAPAILVEIGFISNDNERAAIITQKRQAEIAKAISNGVMDYLKNKGQKK